MLVASMILSWVLVLSVWIRGPHVPANPHFYYGFLLFLSVALAIAQTYLQNATMAFCTRLDINGSIIGYMLLGQALNGVIGSVLNLLSSMAAATQMDANEAALTQAAQNQQAAYTVFIATALLQLATWYAFEHMLHVSHVKQAVESWTMSDAFAAHAQTSIWDTVWRVQRRLVPWSVSIFGLFATTLSVYPGITSRVRTVTETRWLNNDGIFVALHVVCFNVGDLLGRRMPIMYPITNVRRAYVAQICTAARFLFLPFFLWCRLDIYKTSPIPDTIFFLGVVGLGLTTGWLSTSFLISGPQSAAKHDESTTMQNNGLNTEASQDQVLLHDETMHEASAAEHAGTQDAAMASMLCSFWLVAGLTAGGCLSLLLNVFIG